MKISGFYQKHFGEVDNLVINLELTVALFGCIFIILNAVTFQYRGVHYVSYNWVWLAPLLFIVALFSDRLFKAAAPKAAFLLKSYCLYFLGLFAFLIMADGIQYTPFPPVDRLMSAADQALQIKETAMLGWVSAHPRLLTVLGMTYNLVTVQWFLAPILLFCLLSRQEVYLFIVISLLAYSFGAGIYYFFPSIGPASIYQDSHFTQWQTEAVIKFKQVHRSLLTNFSEPMTLCPIFHVIFAVIAIFIYRKAHLAIFTAVLLLNLSAIVGALCLGWSYVIYIAISILAALAAIYCGKRLFDSRLFNNS